MDNLFKYHNRNPKQNLNIVYNNWHNRYFLLIFFCLFFHLSSSYLYSESKIREIYLDRHQVFDTTGKDWFFGAGLLNSLHYITRPYIIDDELLFSKDDEVNIDLIEESERNLRATGYFSRVKIELDSVGEDLYDVYVITKDNWTTAPNILFGTGGGKSVYGGRFEETNFLGTGTGAMIEALYRTENDIGWQGLAQIFQRRFLRSEFSIFGRIVSNRIRTEQFLSVIKPFRTIETPLSIGLEGGNNFGQDFLYKNTDSIRLIPFYERSVHGWISRAWIKNDRVFATLWAEANDINRGSPVYNRAMDNTGKILLAFSSVSQEFIETDKINYYSDEDLPIGGWGTAILGKTFSINGKGESLYYVAGQGERSYYDGNLYLFGQITGSSCFLRSSGVYTYQEFLGLGYYRFSPNILIAARVRQQTVWNWSALRQLILDNDSGLRGYTVNNLSGDNRMVGNVELRYFPDIPFWIFNLSFNLFYDAGAVWKQNVMILNSQWHNAVGFGILIHNTKSIGAKSVFRFDFAFNFDKMKFGEIIFSTDQLFSAFGKHEYRLPQIFGLDYDYE